jgi:hypothetical protein
MVTPPDAEEVYKYVFRLNHRPGEKLSDGFGWSILFVNDSSRCATIFLLNTEPSFATEPPTEFGSSSSQV